MNELPNFTEEKTAPGPLLYEGKVLTVTSSESLTSNVLSQCQTPLPIQKTQ